MDGESDQAPVENTILGGESFDGGVQLLMSDLELGELHCVLGIEQAELDALAGIAGVRKR